MNRAAALLREAARSGVRIWLAEGGTVRLAAASQPAPELLAALGEHRNEIVAALSAPSWHDHDEWCRRLGALTTVTERHVVLREWADAAGGWSDAAAIHLPSCLPAGLALSR